MADRSGIVGGTGTWRNRPDSPAPLVTTQAAGRPEGADGSYPATACACPGHRKPCFKSMACHGHSAVGRQLLAHHLAQGGLEGFPLQRLAQRLVDERLVTPFARLGLERSQHIAIDQDRDALLATQLRTGRRLPLGLVHVLAGHAVLRPRPIRIRDRPRVVRRPLRGSTKNRKTGRYRQTNWSPLLCTARPNAD